MSERILTLFGEEIVPVPKPKAKRKAGEQGAPETQPDGQDADPVVDVPADGPLFGQLDDSVPSAVGPPVDSQASVVDEQSPSANTNDVAPEIPHNEQAEAEPTSAPAIATEDEGGTNLPDDWQGDKQYYTIGEVAGMFKMNTSNIRFWTNEFALKVRTTRKGDRLYTVAQVREIKAIYHLVKERGFTLSGAKAKLKTNKKKEVETVDLRELLLDLKGKLVAIRGRLG
jgi:DNA-binding transcriptional MerR regulator